MFYVYVLRSKADLELYIGSTNDLRRRPGEHREGKSFSTAHRGSFSLVYYEAYANEEEARTREWRLKRHGNARVELLKRIKKSTGT